MTASTASASKVSAVVSETILETSRNEYEYLVKRLGALGVDFASLSVLDALACQRKFNSEWQGSEFRVSFRENAKAAKDAERETARKARAIATAKRDLARKIAVVNGAVKAEVISRADGDAKIAKAKEFFAPLIAAAEKPASA